MNRETRGRLPLAGLLIIFVAPLATLMVVVPSLFAGSVQKIEKSVPAIISRLAPNPSPHDHGPRSGPSGLPPVALVPKAPERGLTPAAPAAAPPAPTAGAASPVPAPAVAPPAQPTLTATTTEKSNHGHRRRHRPQEPLSD